MKTRNKVSEQIEEARKLYEENQRKESDKSLRDQFAMAALTGLLASETESRSFGSPKDISKVAFSIADECMKRREQ